MNGWTYSGFALPRLAAMLRTLSLYGRAWRMRSCALRIFDAATISMALVIFLVLSTDLILPRISLPAAIGAPCLVDQANDFLNDVTAAVSSASASLSMALACSILSSNGPWLDLRN